jgi:putative ABC transport system permease protein
MSRETYGKTFKHGVMFNTILAKAGWEDKDTLTSRLYDSDDVANVTITETVRTKANEAVKGLDAVVVLLTVISSLLAFTVLYNLTAISISERTREIATLKVLGFTPFETNDYIYRETIISSVLGIAAGLLVSPYLLGRVLDVIAVDNLVFLRDINIRSFVIAASLSFIFTLVMMLVTFIRLFRINMIESLKSVD